MWDHHIHLSYFFGGKALTPRDPLYTSNLHKYFGKISFFRIIFYQVSNMSWNIYFQENFNLYKKRYLFLSGLFIKVLRFIAENDFFYCLDKD